MTTQNVKSKSFAKRFIKLIRIPRFRDIMSHDSKISMYPIRVNVGGNHHPKYPRRNGRMGRDREAPLGSIQDEITPETRRGLYSSLGRIPGPGRYRPVGPSSVSGP